MKPFVLFSVLLLNLSACLSAKAVVAPDRTNVCAAPYNAIPNDGLPDTAAINAAVAAGSSIYFPPGTYIYEGSLTLPANKSYRIYGDGPGVSTILFTGPAAGINGSSMGQSTLNVEGLTLKANSTNCGTAISASFSDTIPPTKFRTASIHNVQIMGSTRTGNTGTYWTNGIYLYKAQNAVIDKVEISGNIHTSPTAQDSASLTGIVWESSNDYATTGLQLSNLQIKFVNTALRTQGWVEGLYLFGFEFVLCGQLGMPAVDLSSFDSVNLKPSFHMFNGHVECIQEGVRLTNLKGVKIAKVLFLHNSTAAVPGAMVVFNNCTDGIVSQCTLVGIGSGVDNDTGIRLNNAHSVQIAGNHFTHLAGSTGSGVAVQSNSNLVRIVNNIFEFTGGLGPVSQRYDDQGPDTYFRGNN